MTADELREYAELVNVRNDAARRIDVFIKQRNIDPIQRVKAATVRAGGQPPKPVDDED